VTATDTAPSLQERYAPQGRCFGCGPANPDGLHVRSFPSAEDPATIVAEWTPEPRYEAFEGVLNGGIIGALLDATRTDRDVPLMVPADARPPTTVTLDYAVRFAGRRRPVSRFGSPLASSRRPTTGPRSRPRSRPAAR
jgi:hypothetical protein